MGLGTSPAVRILPLLGVAAWIGAVVWAGLRIDAWGPFLGANRGAFQFFGLAVPTWFPWALAGLGLVAAGAAAWLEGWAWPYLPTALAVALGCGSRVIGTNTI